MRIEMTALEETAQVLLGVLVESPEGSMRVHNHKDIGVLGFEATDIQKASGLSTKQLNSVVEYLLELGALENRFPGHTAPGFVFRFVTLTDLGNFLYHEYKEALEPHDRSAIKILQKVQRQIEELDRIVDCLQRERDRTKGRHRLERWKERTTALFEQDLTPSEVRRFSAVPARSNVEDALREYLSYMNIVMEDIRRRPNEMIPTGKEMPVATTAETTESDQSRVGHDGEINTTDPRKVFVVCGRNKEANKAMFTFLRSIALDPREWTQWVQATRQGSPYSGEVLKKGFQEAKAFVILMTPDDEARLREPLRGDDEALYEINLTPQPRPNVIFEAGMAMMFAEHNTVLVELGRLRPISDILGRHVVRMNNTPERRKELAQRLGTAGCSVDLTGNDWLDAGDFDAALEGL